MERLLYIDFYETSAKVGQRVGHAEVKECIGVYGHALVHESRDTLHFSSKVHGK